MHVRACQCFQIGLFFKRSGQLFSGSRLPMVRRMLLSFIFSLVAVPYAQAQEIPSSASAHDYEIFAGAGEALTFPSSLRYRAGAIEGGYLYNGLFGAAKMF